MTPRWLTRLARPAILRWFWPLGRRRPPEPLAERWRDWVLENVPLCARLPRESQQALWPLVQEFLDRKRFEGCKGLVLTEEMKVSIAAQACVLLLHRETPVYRQLTSVLVYPAEYHAEIAEPIAGGGQLVSEVELLGESASRDTVILAWRHVHPRTRDDRDGRNLVLHEFAHQLDREDGVLDGTPVLESSQAYESWSRVMQREYDRLQRDVARGVTTALDDYGATNPAEFFAVATETFFEKPHTLHKRNPALYAELAAFYRQDPAAWTRLRAFQPPDEATIAFPAGDE